MEDKTMKKKMLLGIYALSLCFVVCIVAMIALGTAIKGFVKIEKPDFTLDSWSYEQYQSNDNFCQRRQTMGPGNKGACAGLGQDEITKLRETAYGLALRNEQRQGFQNLINSLIIIAVSAIVFVPHWIIARRARSAS